MKAILDLAKRMDEPLEAVTHSSGMRIRIARKPGFSRTHAVLTARCGSIDRELIDREGALSLPDGLAHFLEHQMFEDEKGDIAERFARLGASSNAFTSFVQTSYVFDASDAFPECLDLLLSLVLEPHFTTESVGKEMAVIAREIRMVEDDPGTRGFQNLMRALYRTHPVRIPIAGTESSIATITPAMLLRTHRAFYRTGNLALAVVGDVDPDVVFRGVDRAVKGKSGMGEGTIAAGAGTSGDEPPVVAEIRATMDVARPKWLLGIKDRGVPVAGIDLLRREIVTSMLLDLMFSASSEAHERWLGSGVIDDTFGCDYTAEPGFGFVAFASDVESPPGRDERTKLEAELFQEIARVQHDGVREQDFTRVQRRQLGRFVTFFDHLDSLATALSQLALYDLTPFHWIEVVRSVTRQDLVARAKELFDPRFAARSLVVGTSVET